jgi:hypothetical protein
MNTITIARSAADKATLLKGDSPAPTKRRATAQAHPQAPSTLRLGIYMLGCGIAAGAVLYVAAVIGISRVTPEPINSAAHHHTARGNV